MMSTLITKPAKMIFQHLVQKKVLRRFGIQFTLSVTMTGILIRMCGFWNSRFWKGIVTVEYETREIFLQIGVDFGFEKDWLTELWEAASTMDINIPEDCEKLQRKMKEMIIELAARNPE